MQARVVSAESVSELVGVQVARQVKIGGIRSWG
jgi:hypothetical protein